ncbi:hypothetical protein TNIN_90971 [Trichonephila inaurata madagascariensis]|uniref:Uncharacterized protein n=1 Tax=Trichonephila inaurata madagascariensis TaxID=2747483 RepID=A0A8X6I6P1_9ARAC|nr:hypothetical protein TNIN_90971 [Trichonephila inaurata madagascariensis]
MLQIDKVQIPPECCKRGKGMLTPTEEVEVPPTAPKRLGESPPSTSQEHAPERRTLHGDFYPIRKTRFLFTLSEYNAEAYRKGASLSEQGVH